MKNRKNPIVIFLFVLSVLIIMNMDGNCSEIGGLDIPRITKLGIKQLDSLLGKPEIFSESKTIKDYIYQINRKNIDYISFWFYSQPDGSTKMKSIQVIFEKPVDGYKKMLKLLGMRTDLPPDIIAPAVYRWEEKTKLHGYYSVQLLKNRDSKIESVTIVIYKSK